MPDERLIEEVQEILEAASKNHELVQPDGNQNVLKKNQFQYGFGMMLLSIFVFLLKDILPDKGQWLWIVYSIVLLSVGVWYIDKSNKLEQ